MALVAEAGKTPPAWEKDIPLRYPKTLDLTWKQYPGWQPQRAMGAYVFGTLFRNARTLRGGIPVMHHALEVNRGNAVNEARTMRVLGDLYLSQEEWAHAAYWHLKAGLRSSVAAADTAYCFWRLGSKELAVQTLERAGADRTRDGVLIRTWGEVGETEKALAVAAAKTRTTYVDVAYLTAGDACRHAGRLDDAVKYYRSVLRLSRGGRDFQKIKVRARDAADAFAGYDPAALGRVPDGVYEATSASGYKGPIGVAVTVKGGRIERVRLTKSREDRTVGAEVVIPERIVAKQGIVGVDVISGATCTAAAIFQATARSVKGKERR
jgi:uncharacterized protein with FMN-binding domain